MDKQKLVETLGAKLPEQLGSDIVDQFLTIRQDVATDTLGRSAPGKFVETLVQILEYLESGKWDVSPNVDEYLRNLESRSSSLDDGVRICAARIGRAMYTLRNKRSIAHKGAVDPNRYDLHFLHSAAQWVMAELIRLVSGKSMEQAGKLIEQVQMPADILVEDFEGHKVVLEDLTAKEELLVLLHSHYPQSCSRADLTSSLQRRKGDTVRKALQALWADKLVERLNNNGYKLTTRGFQEALTIIKHCLATPATLQLDLPSSST